MPPENDDVVEWLLGQDEWLQEAALRLLQNSELKKQDYDDLLAILKQPAGKSATPRKFPPIVSSAASGSKEIRLRAIGPISGIDRLAPTTPLNFGEKQLVVIYGSNGAGKSGYVRILKKASGKPNAVALKANVFAKPEGPKRCIFDYLLDGNPVSNEWDGDGDPVEDFLNLDIFDTPAARLYLESESEATYTPPAVALFEDLVKAAEHLKSRLNDEKDKIISKLPPLPANYTGTKVAGIYTKISPTSTHQELEKINKWTSEDATALASLETRLKAEDPSAKAAGKRKAKVQIEELRSVLADAAKLFAPEELERRKLLKKDADAKRAAAVEGAKATVSTSEFEGIGTDTWKAMWSAAKAYSVSSAYPEQEFPVLTDDARCVLCHQSLDESAKARLKAFEDFVVSSLEAAANQAEKSWKDTLKNLPVHPSKDNLVTSLEASGLDTQTWLPKLETEWAKIGSALLNLAGGDFPEVDLTATNSLLSELTYQSATLEKDAVQLDADAKQFDRKQAQQDKAELEAKKWTSEQSVAIADEHSRQKTLAQYSRWVGQTGTRGITLRSTAVADKYLTKGYVDRFNGELKDLSAGHISVELVKLPARQGKSKYKIQLSGLTTTGSGPNHVLSEGEQRIVSLAAFLADSETNSHKAPFVFDDPISSLDYEFERACVSRLIELSKTRQVIIFTHRLSLVSMVVDSPDAESEEISIRSYRGVCGQPSTIKPYSGKPEKGLNVLIEKHKQAAKVFNEQGYEAYESLGRATCSEFRTIVEKSVEVVLLDEIVLRFRKSVMTGDKKNNKLSKLLRIQHSDCDLIEEMMTKYSGFMHSHSDDVPIEVPPPDEVYEDLKRMSKWYKDFSGRQIPDKSIAN
ncbi:AAA family ATPase [Haloferula sp. BvORR071]|uniref:AAA family ATPase n=1 Tax=Haloferula sp. BvORR071 TaxID=1396141 RepID=UPI000554A76B|nr:AAA family ATPase [Haloferula sp. BvORR071]